MFAPVMLATAAALLVGYTKLSFGQTVSNKYTSKEKYLYTCISSFSFLTWALSVHSCCCCLIPALLFHHLCSVLRVSCLCSVNCALDVPRLCS